MASITKRSGVTRPGVSDETRQALEQLTHDHFADQTFGFGTGEHLALAGKQNAQWVHVPLTSAGASDVDVPHTLGKVPVFCQLVDWENATTPNTWISARPVKRAAWTATSCRVAVSLTGAGSLDGTIARFLVGGA